jgi:hypothetical protein
MVLLGGWQLPNQGMPSGSISPTGPHKHLLILRVDVDTKHIFSLDSRWIDVVDKDRLDKKIIKTQFMREAFLLNWK